MTYIKIVNRILMAMLLAVIASCKSEVDIEIPEQYPKLVVGSFINPDEDRISVIVRSSNPIFNAYEDIDIDEILTNAVVTISDGTTQIPIPYEQLTGDYSISMEDFPIAHGGTYYLSVDAPGYKSVSASTTVPLSTPYYIEAEVTDIDTNRQDYFPYVEYNFRFRWQDNGQESNFYRLFVEESNFNSFEITDTFFTDEEANGNVLSASAYVEANTLETEAMFYATLINASEDYFLYHRSLSNMTYGDPFSEPTIVYSNINGGLGCFGAFTSAGIAVIPQ